MTDAVKRRLLKGVSANVFGSVLTTAIQLVTVPVLLSLWGTELYGSWLILYSLPALLAMSDWGFENAAGNAITAALYEQDESRALAIFRNFWVIATLASIALIAAGFAIVTVTTPRLSNVPPRIAALVAVLLVVHVCVMLQAGLMRAVFRATGRYAEGVMHQNVARVADAAAVVTAAISGRGILAAAVLMLAARIFMTLVSGLIIRRHARWLRLRAGLALSAPLPLQVKPLLAMMAFPLGFAVSLQGMVAAVGIILGPVAVVTFSTLRTLSRFVFQLGGVISNAMLPEASFAFSKADIALARAIHRRGCQAVLWVTVSLSVLVALFGDVILRAWTRGAVTPDHPVLYLLLLVGSLDALWTASSVIAIGARRYERISIGYVATTVLSLVAALLTLRFAGAVAAPASLLAGTLVMVPFVMATSLKLTDESPRAFLLSIARIPSPMSVFKMSSAREVQA